MINETAKLMTTRNAALILAVAMTEENILGNVQTAARGYPIPGRIFKVNAKYVIIVLTIGAKRNGIANIGFKTIGNPNNKGSLILKNPGTILKRPNFFKNSDFEKHIIAHNASVPPPPPIQMNVNMKG